MIISFKIIFLAINNFGSSVTSLCLNLLSSKLGTIISTSWVKN